MKQMVIDLLMTYGKPMTLTASTDGTYNPSTGEIDGEIIVETDFEGYESRSEKLLGVPTSAIEGQSIIVTPVSVTPKVGDEISSPTMETKTVINARAFWDGDEVICWFATVEA